MMDTNTSSQVAHAVVLVLASTTTSNNHSVELIRIHCLKFCNITGGMAKKNGQESQKLCYANSLDLHNLNASSNQVVSR